MTQLKFLTARHITCRTLHYWLIGIALSACSSNKNPTVDPEELFAHEVVPLLESKCMSCHGRESDKIEGGLNLYDYQNLLSGGDSGKPSITPGNPHESLIISAIKREFEAYAMPPKVGDKLSPFEIEIIEKWIEGGAPWPDSSRVAEIVKDTTWSYGGRIRVSTSGGTSKVWDNRKYRKEDLWAYYPLSKPGIPKTSDGQSSNPIDAFLIRARENAGIEVSPPTSKALLVRRATIDLTGLPPKPRELSDFFESTDPDSYINLIDRLLDSPHYGEQWGRHWLDVVRYADSGGFSNDYMRPSAWRYRDYVIRSFNLDKPYNQFVLEQIAGDEMDPDDPEKLIATGFLRMGPWEHTSMTVAAETRQYYLDDVTNIVGETFMGAPLSCAKCHDHKYDPIPTKDYYSIQAVFATTQFADREVDFLPIENIDKGTEELERIKLWLDKTSKERKRLVDKEEEAAKKWYKEKRMAYLPKRERRKLSDDLQPPRYLGLSFEDLGYRKVLSKRLQLLARNEQRFLPKAFSVYNGPLSVKNSRQTIPVPDDLAGPLPNSYILDGGSVYAPSDSVGPGVLSIISSLQKNENIDEQLSTPSIPTGFDKRRLMFGKWLVDSRNPIFVRSIVNRVWQYHFGSGICETPNNFGATGGQPSHPELLDWLCNYFIENEYSIKKLHKLIMTSEAYKMSSEHPNRDGVSEIDPDNKLLSYFNSRRLEAEEIKDAMLFLSGELNTKVGGFPVRPEINLEVALQPTQTMGSIAPAYQPSRTPEERNRRSIYAEKFRNLIDPDLEVFNKPGTDLSCEKRSESTVTPQVFTMFNGINTRNRSLALANRLAKQYEREEELINQATKLIWCRQPTNQELDKAKSYLAEMIAYHQDNRPAPVSYPTSVKREMFEEMTGIPFEYEEELDIYKDYVPDLQPSDVDVKTRALSDLIAVLFNSNEFVYVY